MSVDKNNFGKKIYNFAELERVYFTEVLLKTQISEVASRYLDSDLGY